MLYGLAKPVLFALDAERAHGLAVWALAHGLVRAPRAPDPASLAVRAFGLDFPNPIGLAAGFDKDARAMQGALALGFGFVEAGTVTPLPQPGNPRPRLFRLVEDAAVINRLGFNGRGIDAFAARLRDRPKGVVGANVGRNKDTADEAADFETGVARLAPLADYVTVNISSPNTPGLRDLQRREALAALLDRLMAARAADRRGDADPGQGGARPGRGRAGRGGRGGAGRRDRRADRRQHDDRAAAWPALAPCARDGRAVGPAADGAVDGGAGRFPPADGGPPAAGRLRRRGHGRRCLRQDPRRGGAGAALHRAGVRRAGAGRPGSSASSPRASPATGSPPSPRPLAPTWRKPDRRHRRLGFGRTIVYDATWTFPKPWHSMTSCWSRPFQPCFRARSTSPRS